MPEKSGYRLTCCMAVTLAGRGFGHLPIGIARQVTSSSLMMLLAAATASIGALVFPFPTSAQTEKILYSFPKEEYAHPAPGNLLYSNGALFGTVTGSNGARPCCGEVFEIFQSDSSWKFHSIYKFIQGSGGHRPSDGLVQDATGDLYGTTFSGGTHHRGTVFQLQNSQGTWAPEFIWNFSKKVRQGSYPSGHLVIDNNGALYGEAGGGSVQDPGVIFELSQSGGMWTETVLHKFKGGRDGSGPYGGLLMDSAGSLWGVTASGGGSCENPCGTVFHLVQSEGVWNETVVHRFGKGSDGADPLGALIEDANGNLYGTTFAGGEFSSGTIFEISPANDGGWTEMVLHDFCSKSGCADGGEPGAGLTWGPNGSTLYGTAGCGGNSCGNGVVFSLTNSGGVWSETVVHSFQGEGDGILPLGAVTVDDKGNLFGTTFEGGQYDLGTIWEIIP